MVFTERSRPVHASEFAANRVLSIGSVYLFCVSPVASFTPVRKRVRSSWRLKAAIHRVFGFANGVAITLIFTAFSYAYRGDALADAINSGGV